MSVKCFFKNLILLTAVAIIVVIVSNNHYNYLLTKPEIKSEYIKINNESDVRLEKEHIEATRMFMEKRANWTTSNLGSILFKNENPEKFENNLQRSKSFTILVWRYWDWLEKRHSDKTVPGILNVLQGCSVHNCKFINNDTLINDVDAVIIHTQKGQIPKVSKRNPASRWIFLNDEAPKNLFSLSGGKGNLNNMADTFNWTMTFRSDADVPVPYGRTLPLSKPSNISLLDTAVALKNLVPFWEKKTGMSMVMMSNCVATRLSFVKALREYLDVHIYGSCSDVKANKNGCPGHFFQDCMKSSTYIFYLVLENSSCRQYLTEKIFHHAYARGAIPVIMGPSLEDCDQLLPPNSYLHVSNYKSIKDLAHDMVRISKDNKAILALHSWRRHFEVIGEHGYFGMKSYHFCRVCEALNYNDAAPKMYSLEDLKLFFDVDSNCDIIGYEKIVK